MANSLFPKMTHNFDRSALDCSQKPNRPTLFQIALKLILRTETQTKNRHIITQKQILKFFSMEAFFKFEF